MPKYNVTVEKLLHQSGVMEIEAKNPEEAYHKVNLMMDDPKKPLQTSDARICWNDPEYIDFSFKPTGDVDEV